MSLSFPTSPTVNQTYSFGSSTYKWDGGKWISVVTEPSRLVSGSNSLEINGNNLVWVGGDVSLSDKNIVIGDVASPTNITADGGGVTLKGAVDKTIAWLNATAAWTFSEHISIASAKEYRIAGTKVLDATSLGSAVVGSSLTSVGTIATGVWNGSVIGKAYLDATVVSTGDTGTVTSTMILNGTILDADINASAGIVDTKLATIATVGKVSNSATTATDTNTATAIVARDASGNFSAGTITASLTGNASTVTTNANLTGDVTSVGNATSIASGVIVNADVSASAAIAGTKISPDFGSQTIATTGNITTTGNVGIGTTNPQSSLDLKVAPATSTIATLGYSANASLNIRIPNAVGNVGQIVFTNNDGPTAGYASIGVVMTSGAAIGLGDIIMSTKSAGTDAVSEERLRITASGNVGIGTTNPDTRLDVRGSIAAGGRGLNVPHVIVKDTNGNIRYFEYYFSVYKPAQIGTASVVNIVTISSLSSFHQAAYTIEYGTRLQQISDSTTSVCLKQFGVNRFNSGNVAITDTNDIVSDTNSNTHANITCVTNGSSGYIIRVEFSADIASSSFASGVIRGWGVADAIENITFAQGG